MIPTLTYHDLACMVRQLYLVRQASYIAENQEHWWALMQEGGVLQARIDAWILTHGEQLADHPPQGPAESMAQRQWAIVGDRIKQWRKG